MIIEVKDVDIRKGVKHSLCNCPIARAVKRQLNISMSSLEADEDRVEVTCSGIEVYRNNTLIAEFQGTKKMGEFVEQFDNDKKVKPGKFKVTAVPKVF